MSKQFDNPVSNKVRLLEVLAKREDYLKHRRVDFLHDEVSEQRSRILFKIDGALDEISFLSQLIYLLGVDYDNK